MVSAPPHPKRTSDGGGVDDEQNDADPITVEVKAVTRVVGDHQPDQESNEDLLKRRVVNLICQVNLFLVATF